MKRVCASAIFVVLTIGGSACPRAKTNVIEACEQINRMRGCEAILLGEPAITMNCKELKSQYELVCKQEEIDYALQAFRADADRICGFKNQDEAKAFRSAFDKKKISARCDYASISVGNPFDSIDEL